MMLLRSLVTSASLFFSMNTMDFIRRACSLVKIYFRNG